MTRTHTLGRLVLATLATVLLVLLGTSAAEARKVANPGPVTFKFEGGLLKVGDETFDAASEDDPITFQGTVAENGDVVIPQSNIRFNDFFIDGPLGTITVTIVPVGNATGVLNPIGGPSSLQVRFFIDINGGGVGGDCRIGSSGSPITLNLTTESSGGRTGSRYAGGVVTLVDGTFAVPGASGCSTFPINVNNEINSQLGLPSPSGRNFADLTASTQPVLQPGVTAAFTASPSAGVAPLQTSFSPAGSTGKAPLSYAWDFTNDGSFDATGASPSFTYTTPGTYTARLRVTDADGDAVTTTRQIVVATPKPDASITKTPVGDATFVTQTERAFELAVTNTGTLATSGPVVVTDALPAGLVAGTIPDQAGWTCDTSGGTVTCTYAPSLAIGETATLTLPVTADGSVLGPVTNTAVVATGGDPNASNDASSATVQVVQAGIDLGVLKRNDPSEGLFRGERATYEITVDNRGTLPTTDRIRVVDVLPAGVAYVGASGTGWTCLTSALPTLRCFTDEVLDPGEAAPVLRIRVDVLSGAPDELDNTATVSTAGESNASNDSSTDLGAVRGLAADFAVSSSHAGDFLAGEPGTYTLKVTNVGTKTAGGQVLVTDTLPAGLVPTAASGPDDADAQDWTCEISGQVVLCTHPGGIEPGAVLEPITITVDVTDAAIGTVTNTATVASADDANDGNDVATDETVVRSPRPDVTLDKRHAADRFIVGQNGTYVLEVTNAGQEPTRGTITVTDTLPAGLGYASATGEGWSCGAAGQVVTCSRDTALRGGQASAITLVVTVGAAAAPGVVNVATVAAPNDTDATNDRDEDPTAVAKVAAPTSLVAEGAVASILRQGLVLRTGLDGVMATLTSNGTAVPGKRIDFRTSSGTFMCSGVTDTRGEARCGTLLLTMLQATLGANYTATFAGDSAFAPSSALGPIIALPRIQIL